MLYVMDAHFCNLTFRVPAKFSSKIAVTIHQAQLDDLKDGWHCLLQPKARALLLSPTAPSLAATDQHWPQHRLCYGYNEVIDVMHAARIREFPWNVSCWNVCC